jgi:hypothetical protein
MKYTRNTPAKQMSIDNGLLAALKLGCVGCKGDAPKNRCYADPSLDVTENFRHDPVATYESYRQFLAFSVGLMK